MLDKGKTKSRFFFKIWEKETSSCFLSKFGFGFFRYGADILRNVLKKIEKSQDEFKKITALIVDFASSVFEICLKRTILKVQINNVM